MTRKYLGLPPADPIDDDIPWAHTDIVGDRSVAYSFDAEQLEIAADYCMNASGPELRARKVLTLMSKAGLLPDPLTPRTFVSSLRTVSDASLTPKGRELRDRMLEEEELQELSLQARRNTDPDHGEAVAQAATPASNSKGKTGRPRITNGWETAAFQAELNILNSPWGGDGRSSINDAILSALSEGTFKTNSGQITAEAVKDMRARHKKRARKEANKRAAAWLKEEKLSLEGRTSEAKKTVKQTFWRSYLKGGHSGDWSYLTDALRRELARLCDNSRSEK